MKTIYRISIFIILLLGITVVVNATTVIDLEWKTKSETNNDFFTIQRSVDGKTWVTIVNISGNGNSTKEHYYTFTDENAPEGIVYYTLIQTDYDGISIELKTISVNNVDDTSYPTIIMYPNPSINYLYLKSNEDYMITGMFTSNNQPVHYYIIAYDTIMIGNLQTGIYYIQYQNARGEIETIPFVKD